RMAANTGERTLIPAIIPPGAAHVNAIYTSGNMQPRRLALLAGVLSTLLADLQVRSVPKADIHFSSIERLTFPLQDHPLAPKVLLRVMRLNCLTEAYSDFWEHVWDPIFKSDHWLLEHESLAASDLGDVAASWTPRTPLRRDIERRNAQLELDVLVAKMLGISADEMSTVYRTHFPVLVGYDRNRYAYNSRGRLVSDSDQTMVSGRRESPGSESGTNPPGNEHTVTFRTFDREADMRSAYEALCDL
ncbi:hypothetical protein ACR4XW_15860, partial [Enemella sp. A6]